MNSTLQRLFQALENDRLAILRKVEALTPDQFNLAPPGKWSINHILSHLIAGERLSVLYIQKKILGADKFEDTGFREQIKMGLLKISQRLPFKFKAPGAVVEHTKLYPDVKSLMDDWAKRREDLRKVLATIPDNHLKKKVYKHPRVGMLNIAQAISFFREHSLHHAPQIRKLLKSNEL